MKRGLLNLVVVVGGGLGQAVFFGESEAAGVEKQFGGGLALGVAGISEFEN